MKYIPISFIEDLLNSKKIESFLKEYKHYNNNYTLLDYISNMESYIYAYLMLDIENDQLLYIVDILNNYINFVILPLSKRKPLILIKSKLCKIMIKIYNNNEVEINPNCVDYIKSFPHSHLYMTFSSNKSVIKSKIIALNSIRLLSLYLEMTNETSFLFETYFNVKKMRNSILNSNLKSYFLFNDVPRSFIYDEDIFINILTIEGNLDFINSINLKNCVDKNKLFIKERLMNLGDSKKLNLLCNKNFIINNSELLILIIMTIRDKKLLNISDIPSAKKLDYEDYRTIYSSFNGDEIKDQLQKNLNKKNILAIKGLLIYVELEEILDLLDKIFVNKNILLEYVIRLKNNELMRIMGDLRFINYLGKYNYIIFVSKLNLNDSEKVSLVNNYNFRNKYKISKIKSFDTFLCSVINELNAKIGKKPSNVSLIDSLCFYGEYDDFLKIQNNICQLIEALYSRKYVKYQLDCETSIILLKYFLDIFSPSVKVIAVKNNYLNGEMVKILYDKKLGNYKVFINKTCLNNDTFFSKLALFLIVSEFKSVKSVNQSLVNKNSLSVLINTKKLLVLKKLNQQYLNFNDNFIKRLLDDEFTLDYYKISDSKIDVLFEQLYTINDIKKMMKYYPILSLEYESDGHKKNIISLIYDKYEVKLKMKMAIKKDALNRKISYLKNETVVYDYLLTKKTFVDFNQLNDFKLNEIIDEIKCVIDFDYKNKKLNREKNQVIKVLVNKYILQLKNNRLNKYYKKFYNTFKDII